MSLHIDIMYLHIKNVFINDNEIMIKLTYQSNHYFSRYTYKMFILLNMFLKF